ncbi:hypothetical protein JT359_10875 [Candidatus Poribacteria bacterium]|nr:hypothetical protein [Candidatus Poribacteria bacterium]
MTDKETQEAKERADSMVKKVRDLVALEDKVLNAKKSQSQEVATLETKLKTSVEELDGLSEELMVATPCFRAYVLPQISDLVGTLKACDTAGRSELAQLVNSLTQQDDPQLLEELESVIITRLKENIDRTFSFK